MAAKTMPDADYLRECFDYNPKTGVLSWKKRPPSHFRNKRGRNIWNARHSCTIAGTPVGPVGHLSVTINYSFHRVHRVIWKLMTGREPVNEIDHKDCDSTNNSWDNLREATRQQNCRNRRQQNKSLLPKGVERLPSGRYRARSQEGGKTKHLGVYETPDQAHDAYCAFTSELYGEFFNSGKRK